MKLRKSCFGMDYEMESLIQALVIQINLIWNQFHGIIHELRGTSTLHLNEPTWIIDGFNELIVDFLFALVIFLDSTQPRPLKSSN